MYDLEIYTTSGLVVATKADDVKLPSKDGEIDVLDNHANYCSILGTGLVEFNKENGETLQLIVSEGFVSFNDNKMTILADAVNYPGDDLVNESTDDLEKELLNEDANSASAIFIQNKIKRIKCLKAIS